MSNEEQFCLEKVHLNLRPPSEEIERRLLVFSDKMRSLAKSQEIGMEVHIEVLCST